MLNKIDRIMLCALVGVVALSSWLQLEPPGVVLTEAEPVASVENVVVATPDFTDIVDVKTRKKNFFNFMMPLVEQENERIQSLRNRVRLLSSETELSESDQQWLVDLAGQYRVKLASRGESAFDHAFFEALLVRVDIIPVSLALAQSAIESAWGTSRFAQLGNNFFGQWCFSSGCGIVPAARPEGKTYEVQKFGDVSESVRAYIHNLNTHFQYEVLRQLRESRREMNKPVIGPALAYGLDGYSARGLEYVQELLSMMKSNDLVRYDLDEADRLADDGDSGGI
ncbi:MAG: glucosaminidase domain-containing protein [Endozoicomonas sp.]